MGDGAGHVSLWDMATGKLTKAWVAQAGQTWRLGFSADSKRLAVGGRNGEIQIWDIGSGGTALSGTPLPSLTLKGHRLGISRLVFSADDRWLVSTDIGGTVKVWSLNDVPGVPVHYVPAAQVETLAFTPDSQTFVSTDWRGDLGEPGDLHAYDRDGMPSKSFHVPPGLFGKSAQVQSVAFSPNGRTAAAAGVANFGETPAGQRATRCFFLQFWDMQTGQAGVRWESPPLAANLDWKPMWGGLHRLAFSPDGRIIAGGFGDGYATTGNYSRIVKLWDAASGQEIRTLTDFHNSISALCFTPNSRLLVVGCREGTVRCFDTQTWAEAQRFIDSNPVASVACSPDGHTLAVGDEYGFIRLTD